MPTFGLAIRAIAARQGARVFRAATKEVEDGAKRADKSIRDLDSRTRRLGATFGLVARSAAGFIGSIAAIAGIRNTIRTIADFEHSANRMRVIMRLTREEFKPIERALRDMGVETKFTADEVAAFGAELAQAGFRGKGVLEVLKSSLDLAAAGAISVKEAGDAVIGTIKQWGFSFSEAKRVADVFTTASFLTAASIQEIGQASLKAAPLAKDLGLSFEQVTAISAILTERIRQAARAGTTLRGSMASLLNPSKQVRDRLSQLGFSANDFNIVGGKLIDAMERMEKKGLDVGIATQFMGRENIIAARIMGEAAPEIRKIVKELENVQVSASEAAAQFEDTLPGAFRKLLSAIAEAQLALGKSGVGGALRNIVDFTRDVVRALTGVEEGFINNKKSVMQFAEALKVIGVGGAVFVALKAGIAAITLAIKGLTLAFAGTGVGSLLIAIGLAASALFALRKEMVTFEGESATIGDFAVATFTVLKEEINFTITAVKNLVAEFAPLKNAINNLRSIQNAVGLGETEEQFRRRIAGLTNVTGGGAPLTISERIARAAANRRRAREIAAANARTGLGTEPNIPGGITPEQINQTSRNIQELTTRQQQAVRFAQEIGDTMSESFGRIITGAESAAEAIKNMVSALAELIIKQTLLQPLANTISFGLTSTLGTGLQPQLFNPAAPFSGASPLLFGAQKGGVITRPMIGLAGEGGPEAILPLKRGSGGELGVASGGSNVVVNMTINTPNADSFRRSQRQVFSDTRKAALRLA